MFSRSVRQSCSISPCSSCAVKDAWSTVRESPPGNWFAPPGSNQSSSATRDQATSAVSTSRCCAKNSSSPNPDSIRRSVAYALTGLSFLYQYPAYVGIIRRFNFGWKLLQLGALALLVEDLHSLLPTCMC